MIKIAIYNLKGGVGKTLTTATLACLYGTVRTKSLIRRGSRRVLVVDCDPQGNLSQYFGRYDDAPNPWSSIAKRTDVENVDIRTGNTNLYDLERDLYQKQDTQFLAQIIDNGQDYDVCLMDCPPAFNMLTINALCAADYLIIPMRLDAFSAQGLVELDQQLESVREKNPALKFLGAVITHDEPTMVSEEAEQILRDNFPIFKTKIGRSRWCIDSTLTRTPLPEMGMNLRPSWQYRKLANEIIKKIK